MDANADFAYVEHGAEFLNSSVGVSPTVPLVTYPDPALGIAVFVEPCDYFYAGAGVYDANGSGLQWGFNTAFHSPNDSVTLFEVGVKPTLRAGAKELPGRYAIGGWYHSGTFDVFDNDLGGRLAQKTHRGNAGLYLTFDQWLYKEDPTEGEVKDQGLAAFFQFGWAPSAYNEITQHYGTGLVYSGLLPTRDTDSMGLMMSHVSLSGRVQSLERRSSETAIELFYRFQITPFISLKPDFQYIVNPGGAAQDSFVVGLRAEFAL